MSASLSNAAQALLDALRALLAVTPAKAPGAGLVETRRRVSSRITPA